MLGEAHAPAGFTLSSPPQPLIVVGNRGCRADDGQIRLLNGVIDDAADDWQFAKCALTFT